MIRTTYDASMLRISLVDGTEFDLTGADEVAFDGSTLEVRFETGGHLAAQLKAIGHEIKAGGVSSWSVFLSPSEWRRVWYNAPRDVSE